MLFVFQDMLYSSQRPKTDLSLFQTPVSHIYSSLRKVPEKRLAVTRYAQGRRGAYA